MSEKILKIGIIGAGIQGVCNALFLQKKGYQVILFDRDEPGNAASYGNAGHFSPYASVPLNRPDIVNSYLPRSNSIYYNFSYQLYFFLCQKRY